MKSRSNLYGDVLRTEYNDGRVQTVAAVSGAVEDTFNVTLDSTGDRKHPNPVSYQINRRAGLYGTKIFNDPSQIYSVQTGAFTAASYVNSNIGMDSNGPSLAYNSALSKLNGKIRGNLDLATDLAQTGETARMIRSAGRVVSYVSDFYRQFRSNPLRAFGSKFLELRYGWIPLVQDVYEAADSLMRYKDLPFAYKAHGRYNYQYSAPGPLVGNLRTVYSGTWDYRCEFLVRLLPNRQRIKAVAGFTSMNPFSIAWEVLPYSFVVDWFVDVGGYIRNLETALIYQDSFHSGFYTYSHRNEGKLFGNGREPTSSAIYSTEGSYYKVQKDRIVLTSYPFPRFPSLTCDLGSGRLLNAAALLSQFLRR